MSSVFLGLPKASAPRINGLKKARPIRSLSKPETNPGGLTETFFQRQTSLGSEFTDKEEMQGEKVEDNWHNLNNKMCLKGRLDPYTRQSSADSSSCGSYKSNKKDLSPEPYSSPSVPKSFDSSFNNNIASLEDEEQSQHRQDRYSQGHQLVTPVDRQHNALSANVNSLSQSLCQDKIKYLFTLVTPLGDTMVISGSNLQNILLASRILFTEMHAVTIWTQSVEDQDKPKEQVSVKVEKEPDEQTSAQTSNSAIMNLIKYAYTKEELLRMSRSKPSKSPPPMWKVLTHIHSACCLPASKVKEYFQVSNFRPHDGTLAVNEARHDRVAAALTDQGERRQEKMSSVLHDRGDQADGRLDNSVSPEARDPDERRPSLSRYYSIED
ncbi:uncharacterized protein LOC131947639 isoform X2 [Physella acuta]|uniref:uncharacterized protein LOC131947639 isoform X2 n=1 Tax=Physella acuta TaxID=109671 RepID=UPI0027DAC57A|nr:uncharacterized protein LOC131947639 isoform X2 [Physella acuta]